MRAEVAGVGDVLPSDRLTIEDAINQECCICLGPVQTNPIVLPECCHAFCFECLTRWQALDKSSKITCPYCRCRIETGVKEDTVARAQLYAAQAGVRNTPNYDEGDSKRLYAKAVKELDKVLTVDDENCDLLFLKAQIAKHIKPREAEKVMDKLICLDKLGYENSLMIDGIVRKAEAMRANENMEAYNRAMDQLDKQGYGVRRVLCTAFSWYWLGQGTPYVCGVCRYSAEGRKLWKSPRPLYEVNGKRRLL